MPKRLTATVIIPTCRRVDYLDRALASIVPQAQAHAADVLIVDDGQDDATRELAAKHGVHYLEREGTPGLNSARNTAIANTKTDLLCFVDDDVEVEPGWLAALIDAAMGLPAEVGVLTGPIRPRLHDHRFRSCGHEGAPITELLLGDADRDCERAWGANMTIRRGALTQVGTFDESLPLYGDEEDWQQRWAAQGGRIRYIAAAGLDHVRRGEDARLRSLCRAAYFRGKSARRYDAIRGEFPSLKSELVTLAKCALHAPRRLCFNGPVMTAHSLGRVAEARNPTPRPARPGVDDFLSGTSGTIGGKRDLLRRLKDARLDLVTLPLRLRTARAARKSPRRARLLAIGVGDPSVANTTASIRKEFSRSRHDVVIDLRPAGDGGKFGNLNAILADHDLETFDYVIATDDDIVLPRDFIDLMIHCVDKGCLSLAQPAHRWRSHGAWPVTRRTKAAWRETTFVEIGPLTLFAGDAIRTLLPFPAELRMGWGLDSHWSAVAQDNGWSIGVVDIAAVDHSLRGIAVDYAREDALAEARSFLAGRPYMSRDDVRTLASHR